MPPRYSSLTQFPPYAFVPGRHPHPTRDPAGHSYGHDEPDGRYWPPEQWRDNQSYLLGVDLYNAGYFWESHEAWEALWMVAKLKDPEQGQFYQAMIQLSACVLKIPMGQPTGFAKLAQVGCERLMRVHEGVQGSYMGLDLAEHIQAFERFASKEQPQLGDQPAVFLKFS